MLKKYCEKLKTLEKFGTEQEQMIAKKMTSSQVSFRTVSEMSDQFRISRSSVIRFVKSMGYPSFKHFQIDYHSKKIKKNKKKEEQSKKFAESLKGDIYIVSSRRSKGVAKFLTESLKQLNFKTYYRHERDNIESFMKTIGKNDTLILISMSGYSYSVSKALAKISNLETNEIPTVDIISLSDFGKHVDNCLLITLHNDKNNKHTLETIGGYHNSAVEFIKIFVKSIEIIEENDKRTWDNL